MSDLRKAAEMALDVLETTWGDGSEGTLKQWEETIQALRQALDVDAVNMTAECVDETAKGEREWVGLTDEEIQAERHKLDQTAGWTYDHFARAIEAKLKEKNT